MFSTSLKLPQLQPRGETKIKSQRAAVEENSKPFWFMGGSGMRCQPSDWHPPRAPTAAAMAGRILCTAGGGCSPPEQPFCHHSLLKSLQQAEDFSGYNLHPSRDAGRVHSSALRRCPREGLEEILEKGMSSPEPLDVPHIHIKCIYLLNGTTPGCFSAAKKPKSS